jgi:Raf kinase inhibitor-like YbhB/YbcL family protein
MKLWSNNFSDGEKIPTDFAFGKFHPENHVELSKNINPHLAWSDLPAGTQSLVLICHDPDVPSSPEDVNQEGKTVPVDLPRVDFFHWLLCDIDPNTQSIAEGTFSSNITPHGKPPQGPFGTQGINNYTDWFKGDADMEGTYYGYDGPCPPWNDSIVHHYHFTLYALGAPSCKPSDNLTGPDLLEAIQGHILAQTSLIGTYTINPKAIVKN